MTNLKRIIALCLGVILSLSVSAFASTDLPFFDKIYTSYEQKATLEFKLNDDFKLFYEFDEDEFNEINTFVNLKKLVERIFDSKTDMILKSNLSDDYLKGQISIEEKAFMPFEINKNLSLDAKASVAMWIDYDFTDLENPKFYIIQSHPMFDKYIKMDLIKMLKEDENVGKVFAKVMADLLNKDSVLGLNKAYKDLILKYAKITVSGQNYTISIDNTALKGILSEGIDYLVNYVKAYLVNGNFFTQEIVDNVYLSQIEPVLINVKNALENVDILGDEGIKLKYRIDRKAYIESLGADINIKFNVFDIIKLISGYEEEYKDYNNGVIDFSIKLNAVIENIGKNINIEFPLVTEENSIDFNDEFMGRPQPEYEAGEKCWHYDYYYTQINGFPVIKDGVYYAPLRAIAKELGFADYDISYDNGMIVIARPEWVKCGNYAKAVFTCVDDGDNNVYLDGKEFALDNKVLNINGTIYVASDFAKIVFNIPEYDTLVCYNILDDCYDFSFMSKYCDHIIEE
ncbi:MAG: hypothetical protein E7404_08205 [Ruminococcaceae bacterium]|nr:hypothetical protein [Oscillospiraceae bacterium]